MTAEFIKEIEDALEWYEVLRERLRKITRDQLQNGTILSNLRAKCDHTYPDGTSATIDNLFYAECQICGGSR